MNIDRAISTAYDAEARLWTLLDSDQRAAFAPLWDAFGMPEAIERMALDGTLRPEQVEPARSLIRAIVRAEDIALNDPDA